MSIDFKTQRDVLYAFTTPIAQIEVKEAAEINPVIAAEVARRAAAEPGLKRSNVGGWHSGDDFFDWPLEEIALLSGSIREAVNNMAALVNRAKAVRTQQEMKGWANLCQNHDYHLAHNHALYHWSGVYFVDDGAPEDLPGKPGILEFQDPRGAVGMEGQPGNPFGRTVTVVPKGGLMAIFPSWLLHWVRPHQGARARISIAFNVRVKDLETR